MNRRQKVELVAQSRHEEEFGLGTMVGVARQGGVQRRWGRQALQSAGPPARQRPVRSGPWLAPGRPRLEARWEPDRQALRQQRHTAHRSDTHLRVE